MIYSYEKMKTDLRLGEKKIILLFFFSLFLLIYFVFVVIKYV